MRSDFEKIKDVKERLNLCYFDSDSSGYLPYDRFNYGSAAYVNGAWYAFQHQQSKVDELQKKLDEYIFVAESIDEMYEREVKKNNELQKRMDAVKQLIEDYKDPSITSDKSFQHGLLLVADELEQALKGGCDE